MYQAIGKQRGTAVNNGDLKPLQHCEKVGIYQGKCLVLATAS
jgi:hypothetical protein